MRSLSFYRRVAVRTAQVATEPRLAWPIDWPSTAEGVAVIDKLSKEALEEGRDTLFVAALVDEVRARRAGVIRQMIESGASGEAPARLNGLAGRAAALGDVLRLIRDSEGRQQEEEES